MGNKDDVKPMAPYTNNPQEIVYKKFVDYKTGRILEGTEYWKSLSDTLWEYVNHKESKFDGDIGILERKHVFVGGAIRIGKETENIEETGIIYHPAYTVYQNEEKLKEKIMKTTSVEARIIGLNRKTFWAIKKRAWQNKALKLHEKTAKIINKFEMI